MGLYVYTYPDLTCVYLTFIWTCVLVIVITVLCSLFLSICLFVLVNCLLNAFAVLGGVIPYFDVTGHPVPVSSLGFKCPDCFICNWSYIVYPSKMKGPFRDNCLRYYYL